MALATVHFGSGVLQKQMSMTVILPDGGKPPFATLYLLHGLSDDHSIWNRRTRLETYVAGHPLMVVMPDGLRGFYTDHEDAGSFKFGQYTAVEIPEFVERTFPAKRTRGGRAIGGLSMGGYGALRAALNFPDRFVSAHSHSGAVMHGSRTKAQRAKSHQFAEQFAIFGKSPAGTHHDLMHLGLEMDRKKLPAMLLDCGTEDFLLEDNRALHRQWESAGVPHEYIEYPGSHNWDYWDEHIRDALAFHGKHLRL